MTALIVGLHSDLETIQPTCSVDGCERPRRTTRWCSMHHSRLLRHGDLGPAASVRAIGCDVREHLAFHSVPQPNGCILWTASLIRGYGRVNINGQGPRLAHRVSYELSVGPIPDGLVLDHLCRTPRCINPAHLEPVTNAENIRRGYYGSKTHCPKGHPYSGDNVIVRRGKRDGLLTRQCRACKRMRDRGRGARRRAAA